MARKYRIGVDVGGTFTDLVVADEGGRLICLAKAPSRPGSPEEGVIDALGRAADSLGIDTPSLLGGCERFVHGTTVATNALLTRRGAKVGLLATEGFRDALAIRRGIRENVWDHRAPYPPQLVPRYLRLPVGGRIDWRGEPLAPLEEAGVRAAVDHFAREGVEAVAVCLFNAYLNPAHEERAGEILSEALPEAFIVLSSRAAPIMGEYERTSTAAVSAFLGPRISAYLGGLEEVLARMGYRGPLMLLQSNGGMATVAHCRRHPAALVLSGPAAGAAAGRIYAAESGIGDAVFFDMGGTSCDVTLLRGGRPGMVDRSAVGGYHVALPSVEVHTIGTGGGTVVWVDSGGGLRVGPESAGAEPGPASYGRGGGLPTLTDAHLLLGRLDPSGLLGGEMPLSSDLAEEAFSAHAAKALGMTAQLTAAAAVRLASRQMAGAVQTICARHGADPRRMALVAGGGAGGLSAPAVGRICGMSRVIVPREAAGACAVGMAGSPVRYDRLRSRTLRLGEMDGASLKGELDSLRDEVASEIEKAGSDLKRFSFTPAVDMRYPGQAWHLTVEVEAVDLAGDPTGEIARRFHALHEETYGHHRPGEPVEVTGFRVRAEAPEEGLAFEPPPGGGEVVPEPVSRRRVYFESVDRWEQAAVYRGDGLGADSRVEGPAIVEEPTTTVLVEPGDTLRLGGGSAFVIDLASSGAALAEPASAGEKEDAAGENMADPVTLAILQQRLDVIAREMGIIMQRTARSTIFSQAHDFSCFICDAGGRLISQADGLPIHTGSGGFAVRGVLGDFAGEIHPGDLFLLNDPYMGGGNHLPDWTVIAPVFVEGALAGFVCNRAHQVDVGGGVIGTYNSDATEIFHEGFRITPVKIHERGEPREDLVRLILANTRAPEVIAHDFAAMVGSTRVGSARLAEIGGEMGRAPLAAGLAGLLDYSEALMRAELAQIPDGVYTATEYMNTDCFEPAEIPVKLTLTKKGTDLTADFTGSAPQMKGYKNSPIANTCSALYVGLSSMMDPLIPHNEGTYRPVEIIAPEGSVVNASFPAPVTLCTVFPSHEIAQCVWKAMAGAVPGRVSAAWGKTAYPVTAGFDERGEFFVVYHWGGGPAAGAVEGRDGFPLIGNMPTLGALTIPNLEHYEQDYPVRFIRQTLRPDGGGPGRWRGGTGVIYECEMRAPVSCSTRGESCRTVTTFGLEGGGPGAIARVMFGADAAGGSDGAASLDDLPQYANVDLPPGRLLIEGPGGGGFGEPFTRPSDLVAADVRDGLVSAESAKKDYGVVVDPETFEIDEEGTEAARGRVAGI
jgi:N-methylhydantoinase A/oxoprolinase/acetone carboxylase beta subunit/N-methylhydantoinase B/oxoprolinase/acetone carboxylase alpha subunit